MLSLGFPMSRLKILLFFREERIIIEPLSLPSLFGGTALTSIMIDGS